MFSQDGVLQTYKSVSDISRNTGILQSSIEHIIHDLFTATHPEESNVTCSVANVFSGSVATQIR